MENVWDYPRPPAVEPCRVRVRVEHGGTVIADSTRAVRVLETSHPPSIYVPPEDIDMDLLAPNSHTTVCEYKGRASYFDVAGAARAAWAYPHPEPAYAELRDFVSFYPDRVDVCRLGDEVVQPEGGGFYGGWVTGDIAR
jgi:uncharacterized protein (DUF427 family)